MQSFYIYIYHISLLYLYVNYPGGYQNALGGTLGTTVFGKLGKQICAKHRSPATSKRFNFHILSLSYIKNQPNLYKGAKGTRDDFQRLAKKYNKPAKSNARPKRVARDLFL